MSAPNPKIDAFLDQPTEWREEMKALRNILLDCDLTEEIKWRIEKCRAKIMEGKGFNER